jgi:gluconokinase
MILLVMGVTGAGKTTVGKLLAEKLHWTFLDADAFHPPANIEKMKRGIPLSDLDRAPWLAAIHAELLRRNSAKENIVLACSALKRAYRAQLAERLDVQIIYLQGSFASIRAQVVERQGHFAGEAILAAQFADLEEPSGALACDVATPPEEIVSSVCAKLNLK